MTDTKIDDIGVSSNFYKNSNSTLTAPVFISGEASLTKTVSLTIAHSSISSWRAWFVECSLTLAPEAGGSVIYQKSAMAARKLNTSIVKNAQEDFSATTTLFAIDIVHIDAENTRVDINITSPSATWGAIGDIRVGSGNGFGTYVLS